MPFVPRTCFWKRFPPMAKGPGPRPGPQEGIGKTNQRIYGVGKNDATLWDKITESVFSQFLTLFKRAAISPARNAIVGNKSVTCVSR